MKTLMSILVLLVLPLSPAAWAESIAGQWDATINFNGTIIPFRLDISGEGAKINGAFVNGSERESSTSGKFEQGSLVLSFDYYATELSATLNDDILEGQWGPYQKKIIQFKPRGMKSCNLSFQKHPISQGSGRSRVSMMPKEREPGS